MTPVTITSMSLRLLSYAWAALAVGLKKETMTRYAEQERDHLERAGPHAITVASLRLFMAERRNKRDT